MKLDASLLRERGALLEGHFRLTSGLHSASYLQCARILIDPALATDLGGQLAAALGGRALFTERQDGAMVAECPLCAQGSRLEKRCSRVLPTA
jgi:hypothetical protein